MVSNVFVLFLWSSNVAISIYFVVNPDFCYHLYIAWHQTRGSQSFGWKVLNESVYFVWLPPLLVLLVISPLVLWDLLWTAGVRGRHTAGTYSTSQRRPRFQKLFKTEIQPPRTELVVFWDLYYSCCVRLQWANSQGDPNDLRMTF